MVPGDQHDRVGPGFLIVILAVLILYCFVFFFDCFGWLGLGGDGRARGRCANDFGKLEMVLVWFYAAAMVFDGVPRRISPWVPFKDQLELQGCHGVFYLRKVVLFER